jgi:glycyl-tRNA synthetase
MKKDELVPVARDIHQTLRERYSTLFDVSGSIGKRYARMDEIGTPFCITVDFDTLTDDTVTIRDRDSTEQKRVAKQELEILARELVSGKITFKDLN